MDEIGQAQERLGRVLDRARAGEDRALPAAVREEGERLVTLLNGVLATARVHALNNHAFDQPLRDLAGVLGRLVERLGAVHLLAVEDQVFVNDLRIRLEAGEAARDLGTRLRLHGSSGISFHAALPETSCRLLVAALAGPPDPDRPRAALQSALLAKGLDAVVLVGVPRLGTSGEEEPAHLPDARAVAATAAALADEAWSDLAANRAPNPLPLRRVVLEILEGGASGETLLAEPDGASPYAAHAVRVCRLALLLGKALGLPAGALQDLGVAALFHDVGYAAREGVELSDGRASGGGTPSFARHAAAGARVLLRQRGFHEAKVRRLLAALDHHRRYDDPRGTPSLFGRLIAIVEDYETWIRPSGGAASPAEALARLCAGAGTVYDPTLVQLLANALGRFPPGTLLRLADGREARVSSLARSPETFETPLVRIERLADGTPAPEPTILDLAEHAELLPAKPIAEAAGGSEPTVAAPPEATPAPASTPTTVGPLREATTEAQLPEPATVASAAGAVADAAAANAAADGSPPEVEEVAPPRTETGEVAAPADGSPSAEAPFQDWTQLDDGLPDEAHAEPGAAPAAPTRAPKMEHGPARGAAPSGAPSSAAAGVLSAGTRPLFPGALPQILRDIHAGRRSGFLTLIRGHERRGVRFWNGSIMYGRSNVYEEQMGMLGVRLSLLTEEDLERASGIARRENERLGDVLCGLGLLTSEGLRDLVARHARQVLEKAIPWTKGSFEFEVTTEEPTWFERLPSSLSTADIILEAARAIEDPEVIAWHLGDVDRVVVPASETPAEAISCRLTAFDGFVLSRADGRLTAREIMSIVPNDVEDVQRALFGLLCIGFVHSGARRAAASA